VSVGDVADPTEAVSFFLLERFTALVEGRVYRPELPELDDPKMPLNAIVCMPAGGGKLLGGTRLPMKDTLIDILCYGETRMEADNIARSAEDALSLLGYVMQPCSVAGGHVLMCWSRTASGINPRVEGQAEWPYSEFTIQLLHSRKVLP
jgi:hypothetical protein